MGYFDNSRDRIARIDQPTSLPNETQEMVDNQQIYDELTGIEAQAQKDMDNRRRIRDIANASAFMLTDNNGGVLPLSVRESLSAMLGQPILGGANHPDGGFVYLGANPTEKGKLTIIGKVDALNRLRILQNAKLGDRTLPQQQRLYGMLRKKYTPTQLANAGVRDPDAPVVAGQTTMNGKAASKLFGITAKPKPRMAVSAFGSDGEGGFTDYDSNANTNFELQVKDGGTRAADNKGRWKVVSVGSSDTNDGKKDRSQVRVYENDKTGERVSVKDGETLQGVLGQGKVSDLDKAKANSLNAEAELHRAQAKSGGFKNNDFSQKNLAEFTKSLLSSSPALSAEFMKNPEAFGDAVAKAWAKMNGTAAPKDDKATPPPATLQSTGEEEEERAQQGRSDKIKKPVKEPVEETVEENEGTESVEMPVKPVKEPVEESEESVAENNNPDVEDGEYIKNMFPKVDNGKKKFVPSDALAIKKVSDKPSLYAKDEDQVLKEYLKEQGTIKRPDGVQRTPEEERLGEGAMSALMAHSMAAGGLLGKLAGMGLTATSAKRVADGNGTIEDGVVIASALLGAGLSAKNAFSKVKSFGIEMNEAAMNRARSMAKSKSIPPPAGRTVPKMTKSKVAESSGYNNSDTSLAYMRLNSKQVKGLTENGFIDGEWHTPEKIAKSINTTFDNSVGKLAGKGTKGEFGNAIITVKRDLVGTGKNAPKLSDLEGVWINKGGTKVNILPDLIKEHRANASVAKRVGNVVGEAIGKHRSKMVAGSGLYGDTGLRSTIADKVIQAAKQRRGIKNMSSMEVDKIANRALEVFDYINETTNGKDPKLMNSEQIIDTIINNTIDPYGHLSK